MAEGEPKQSYGGYDHEFIGETPDRYNCQICTKVIREPHLAVCCGQHFCESCLNKWFTRQGEESCPHCRAEGEGFNHVINKGLRSEINQLKVKCSNRGKGCEWTGELGALKTHLESEKGCGLVVVECPNKCAAIGRDNIITMVRKDLEKHLSSECYLRPYQCEYCGIKDTYVRITGKIDAHVVLWHHGSHYNKCPAYPLACPNICGASGIERRDMESHLSQCPQEPVECPFTEAGCPDRKLRRHQLDNHLASNQQKHVLLMMGTYKQVKDKLMETEAKLTETEAKLMKTEAKLTETEAKLTTALQLLSTGTNEDKETMNSIIAYSPALMKDGDNLSITMPKVSEYHRSRKTRYSPPFYYKEGYKMCLMVSDVKMESDKCTDLSVSVKLLQGENDDKLKWPVGHATVVQCVDSQLNFVESDNSYNIIHMCGLQRLETRKELSKATLNSSKVVNDCLTFNVRYSDCYLFISQTSK